MCCKITERADEANVVCITYGGIVPKLSVTASKLADDDCPQELRNRWELETSNRKNKRIIAYLTHR